MDELLHLNKHTGDYLTAEEFNRVGEHVDHNTSGLKTLSQTAVRSVSVRRIDVKTKDEYAHMEPDPDTMYLILRENAQ